MEVSSDRRIIQGLEIMEFTLNSEVKFDFSHYRLKMRTRNYEKQTKSLLMCQSFLQMQIR